MLHKSMIHVSISRNSGNKTANLKPKKVERIKTKVEISEIVNKHRIFKINIGSL